MTRYFDAEKLFKHLNTDMSKPISTDYDNGKRGEDVRIKNLIDRQPEADVQPVVHAKWIHDANLYCGMINLYHCSNCGRAIRTPYDEKLENYPYCYCGARMDGDEHDK